MMLVDEIARIAFPFVFVGLLVLGWKVGGRIGEWRGRRLLGACLGATLGAVGWLITALLPRTIAAEAKHRLEVEVEMNRRRPNRKPGTSVTLSPVDGRSLANRRALEHRSRTRAQTPTGQAEPGTPAAGPEAPLRPL